MVCQFSFSLFLCSSIERGLRMPRATGGGKTPSFALATPLAPFVRQTLFHFLFASSYRDLSTYRLLLRAEYLKAILRLLFTLKRFGTSGTFPPCACTQRVRKERLNVPLETWGCPLGKKEICANTFTRDDTVRSLGFYRGLDDSNVVTHLLDHSTLLFLRLFRLPFQLSSVNRIPYPLFVQHLYISYRGFPTPFVPRTGCGRYSVQPTGQSSDDHYRCTVLEFSP